MVPFRRDAAFPRSNFPFVAPPRPPGTGGTFHGAGKYIKERSPGTRIVLAEPGSANLVASGIKTDHNADGSPATSHPAFKSHPIQGEPRREN